MVASIFSEKEFDLLGATFQTRILSLRCVPKSIIVCPKEEEDNSKSKDLKLKKSAHKLYEKYIKVGSEFELNIISKLRNRFIASMDNFEQFEKKKMTEEDFFDLFTPIINEMYSLQGYSFIRFVTSQEFSTVRELLAGDLSSKTHVKE